MKRKLPAWMTSEVGDTTKTKKSALDDEPTSNSVNNGMASQENIATPDNGVSSNTLQLEDLNRNEPSSSSSNADNKTNDSCEVEGREIKAEPLEEEDEPSNSNSGIEVPGTVEVKKENNTDNEVTQDENVRPSTSSEEAEPGNSNSGIEEPGTVEVKKESNTDNEVAQEEDVRPSTSSEEAEPGNSNSGIEEPGTVEVKKENNTDNEVAQEEDVRSSDPSTSAASSSSIKIEVPAVRQVKVEKVEASSSTSRPSCRFGIRCYRQNLIHRQEEAHPGDPDYRRPDFPPPPDGVPDCPYGVRCYRRNPQHFQSFKHPTDTDFNKNYSNRKMQLRKRNRAQAQASSDDDSEEDPFEGDESEEDPFANDDSDLDYQPSEED